MSTDKEMRKEETERSESGNERNINWSTCQALIITQIVIIQILSIIIWTFDQNIQNSTVQLRERPDLSEPAQS